MVDLEAVIFDDQVPDEFMSMGPDALRSRIRLLANEIRVLKVPMFWHQCCAGQQQLTLELAWLECTSRELSLTEKSAMVKSVCRQMTVLARAAG